MLEASRILIVEDDPLFSSFLKDLLTLEGYKLQTADCGLRAISGLNGDTVDLILLDIGLPDMDGTEILDHFRKNTPGTPVIIITGNASIDSAINTLQKGAYDYLEKPIQTKKLLKKIQNALAQRKMEAARNHVQQQFLESEEKYHRLFEIGTDAFMIYDAETLRFEDANKASLDLFGYSKKEFLTLQVKDLSAEKEKTQMALSRIKSGEQGSRFIPLRYLKKKDGSVFPGEISISLFSSGKRKKVIASIRDVTQRQQAQEALQQSEQRFRALVENSLVGISIIQNNRYVYKNPNQEKIFGPVTDERIDEIIKIAHPDDADKVKAVYERLRTGKVGTAEIEVRFYPAGDIGNQADMKWIQLRASAIKYRGEDAILLNISDTTKAKQLERQLIIKNKMLSLGRVAAGIAHEIRNPLTGINSYLYTLDDLCHAETINHEDIQLMQQIVGQIQVASNKIEAVIKRVMDFSKPGAPQMVLSDLNASVEEAIKLSVATMRKIGIQIQTSLSPRLPRCYADSHLIEQVILNLIINAAKSFEKSNDDKIIEVASFSVNNRLFLQVSDSGPGVPTELRNKIFDPFFTTREDGSGIGLNIAQRIVADHNGSIALGTSKWGGAEFRIELPMEKRMNPR